MVGRRDGAFTLLEILLAIAVVALIATSVIGLSSRLVAGRAASPEDIFWKACAAARKSALETGSETRLAFDDKTKAFVISNAAASKSLPVPAAPGDDLAVSFFSGQAGGASSILVGGSLVETGSVAFVTFYPDGTCTPFRLQIRRRDDVHSLSIDPWTCARVLKAAEAGSS